MTTDPIAAAIDHIRSITPADNPWTADDVSSFSPWEPDESDHAIATILNAVVAGRLIPTDTLEAERTRAEKAETKLDQSREFLVACIRGNTKLKEKASKARLEGWRAGREAAADEAQSCTHDPYVIRAIRALPEPKEASHD